MPWLILLAWLVLSVFITIAVGRWFRWLREE